MVAVAKVNVGCLSTKLKDNQKMSLERKNYSFLSAPVGPYVHAVKYNNLLYLSGVTAFETEAQAGGIEIQAKEIFKQIQNMAEAEGSGLDKLIKITAFVTDLARMKELRQVLFDIYQDNIPASSLIKINGLFSNDLKIEVEAIIALPEN